MAQRIRPKYSIRRKEPLDAKVFNYLVTNENGKCSLNKLLQTFNKQFRSEDEIEKWVANLLNTKNRQLLELKETGTDSLIRVSLNGLEVCKSYGYGGNCKSNCSKIHLCLYNLKGHCFKKDGCIKSHNIKDKHNREALSNHNLTSLDARIAFKVLRYIYRWNKGKSGADDAEDVQSMVSEVESVSSLDDMDPDGPDEIEIFRTILNEYGDKCTLKTLTAQNPELGTENELEELFNEIRRSSSNDELFEFDGEWISLQLPGIKLCHKYKLRKCRSENCDKLHLCKFGVLGSCRYGAKCKFYHNFRSGPKERLIKPYEDDGLTEDEILSYLKIQLQKSHTNDGGETDGDSDSCSVKSDISSVSSATRTVDRLKLFRHILCLHNGKCGYGELIGVRKFGFKNKNDIRNYVHLGEGRERFTIVPRTGLGGDIVIVTLGGVHICEDYNDDQSCQKSDCDGFHLCDLAVKGRCEYGSKCKHYHNLHNVHSRNLMKKLQLSDLKDEDILLYLKLKLEEKEEDLMECETMLKTLPDDTCPETGSASKSNDSLRLSVLRFLLKQQRGICSLREFTTGLGFKTEEEALLWINCPDGSAVCKIYQLRSLLDPLVVTSVRYLGLCSAYQSSGCDGCDLVHLCRDHIAGSCTRDACKFIHWVTHSKNTSALTRAQVQSLSRGEIFLAIQFSLPHVCAEYNSRSGCKNPICIKVHICAEFARKRCLNGGKCKWEHNLSSAHNKNLESIYGKQINPTNVYSVFNIIPLPDQIDPPVKSVQPKMVQPKERKPGIGTHCNSVPDLRTMGVQEFDHWRQDGVMQCMLKTPNGHIHLSALQQLLQHEFATTTDLFAWLTGPIGRKMCVMYQHAPTPHQTLVILQIHRFQLCFRYCLTNGCNERNCTYFHICKDFLNGMCTNKHCSFSHDISTIHNQNIVKSSGITFQSYGDVLAAIRLSLPKVCEKNNSSNGCRDFPCGKFHICLNYVKKTCPFSACMKGHDFQTCHNRELLSTLGYQEKVAFRTLQLTIAEEGPKLKEHVEKPLPEEPKKIHKTNVLRCLLTREEEELLVEDLVKMEEFKQVTSHQMLNWLNSREGEEICRVFPAKTPGKHVVSLCIRKLRLCFGYCGTRGCEKKDCEFMHLCREFIARSCDRPDCKYSHEIRGQNNENIVHKSALNSLPDEDLIKAIRRSTPQVCVEHNSHLGCQKSVCMKFHICADNVRKRCQKPADKCPKGHGMTSQHNQQLLDMYEKTENVMFMMIIVPSRESTPGKIKQDTVQQPKQVNTREAKLEAVCLELILPTILMNYDGFCSWTQFIQKFPAQLSVGMEEIKNLFSKPTIQNFLCTFSAEMIEKVMVVARIKDIGMCYAYCGKNGCKRAKCSYLHLCRGYTAGHCSRGEDCSYSHNIEERQNAKVLDNANVPQSIPKDVILKLIQNSIPCVCQEHNTGNGCQKDNCFKFHICSLHLKRSCRRSSQECRYGHSIDTAHNKAMLELYSYTSEEISGKILAADLKPVTKIPGTEPQKKRQSRQNVQSSTARSASPTLVRDISRKQLIITAQQEKLKTTPNAVPAAASIYADPPQIRQIPPSRKHIPSGMVSNNDNLVKPSVTETVDVTVNETWLSLAHERNLRPTSREVSSKSSDTQAQGGALSSVSSMDSVKPKIQPRENQSPVSEASSGYARSVSGPVTPGTRAQSTSSSADTVKPKIQSSSDTICTRLKLHLSSHDAPSIPICHKFLAKTCRNRDCDMHHHNMPFLWCYSVGESWKSFGNHTSQTIEEKYCEPESMLCTVSVTRLENY